MFESDTTPLVRTDFSDDNAWERTVSAVTAPLFVEDELNGSGDYEPNITPVEDRNFEDLNAERLASSYDEDRVGYVLLADKTTMGALDDPTVVYVDMYDEPGRAFRCSVAEIASIEVNLSIANMDFEEFADSVGPDGVFRGFDG
jgi:hypothetical protein